MTCSTILAIKLPPLSVLHIKSEVPESQAISRYILHKDKPHFSAIFDSHFLNSASVIVPLLSSLRKMIIVTLYAAICCNFSLVIAVLLSAGFAITGFGAVSSCLAGISEKRLFTGFTLALNNCRSTVWMLVPPTDTAFIGAVFFME